MRNPGRRSAAKLLTRTRRGESPESRKYMAGVGRIYQQTFIDTYAKVAFTKLYKTPINAADLLNDRVVPFISQTAAY
jgi:uncharacterized protein (DUF2235 family)